MGRKGGRGSDWVVSSSSLYTRWASRPPGRNTTAEGSSPRASSTTALRWAAEQLVLPSPIISSRRRTARGAMAAGSWAMCLASITRSSSAHRAFWQTAAAWAFR